MNSRRRVGLFALLLCVAACSTMTVDPLKTGDPGSYALHKEKAGIAIGIHPMTTKSEVRQAFKTNLLDEGVMPILVVVQNHDASQSFIVTKEKVHVLDVSGDSIDAAQRASRTSAGGEALVVVGAGGPLMLVGIKMMSDSQVIQHNLADKEFYSRTLAPGQKAEGFLYFNIPKESGLSGNYRVVAEFKNASTGEVISFEFPVNLTLAND